MPHSRYGFEVLMAQKSVYLRTESGDDIIEGASEIEDPNLLIYLLCCDGTMDNEEICAACHATLDVAESALLDLEASGHVIVRLRDVSDFDLAAGDGAAVAQAASSGPVTLDALSRLRKAAQERARNKQVSMEPDRGMSSQPIDPLSPVNAPVFGGELLKQIKQKALDQEDLEAGPSFAGFKLGFGKKKTEDVHSAAARPPPFSDKENEELRLKAAELFKKGTQNDLDQMNRDLDFLAKTHPLTPPADPDEKPLASPIPKPSSHPRNRKSAHRFSFLKRVSYFGVAIAVIGGVACCLFIVFSQMLNGTASRCNDLVSHWIGPQSTSVFCESSSFPTPQVYTRELSGGKKNFQADLAHFYMSWGELFKGNLQSNQVVLMGVKATSDFLFELAETRPDVSDGGSLSLENMTLYFGSFSFNNLTAKAHYLEGKIQSLALENPDKSFLGTFSFHNGDIAFEVSAKPAALPFLNLLTADGVDVSGKLALNGLAIDKMTLQLKKRSKLTAQGALSWANSEWEADFKISADQAYAADVLPLLFKDGKMSLNGRIKAKSETLDGLWSHGSAEMHGHVNNPEIDLDLPSLAKGERPYQGGTLKLPALDFSIVANDGNVTLKTLPGVTRPVVLLLDLSMGLSSQEIIGNASASSTGQAPNTAKILYDFGTKHLYLESRSSSSR